ncbi:SAPS-domain-containing protein [Patellaria atrata CBS 101060]|uniref:SAPS-domain-containing protein n=1 Tax=Patellaria atrata CBS 101060 TaxID=1346257 RepID=A0A9P4VU18_9PEZI|nr:SAPS-domain-containing protein [Patellaria atrata CBS 101060]
MFWRFGGYASISTLDTLLDKPDVTIEEVLEESEMLQELKQQNSKLIEYIREEQVLTRLLEFVVAPGLWNIGDDQTLSESGKKSSRVAALESFFSKARGRSISSPDADEPEDSKEDRQRVKFAYLACEILSSEVWSISEALLENQQALRKFWEYLNQPPPLNPVQAGYFSKINDALLDRKPEEMLEFFKTLKNVVPNLLQHVDTPMVMDLLLKIISLEKSESGVGIVDWLQMQNMIPILLSYLSPKHSSATQTSAGDFLKAVITISANATTQDQSVIGPNELTRQLVSDPCIKTLIEYMLEGGNPLTVGVGIIIEVIRKNNSDYDMDNTIGPYPKPSDPIYLGCLLRQFAQAIPDFMAVVSRDKQSSTDPTGKRTVKKRELKAAFGETIEPLGFDRFKTCELMAELLHCSNMVLLNERGAEGDIRARDRERERLKKAAQEAFEQSYEAPTPEFSNSVDSQGFHHTKAPSTASDSIEEIKHTETSHPIDDEEFEDVSESDDVLEELKLLRESHQQTKAIEAEDRAKALRAREKSQANRSENNPSDSTGQEHIELVDEPLDAPKSAVPAGTNASLLTEQADSPTGLSDKVGGLGLSGDVSGSDVSKGPSDTTSAASAASSKQLVSLLTEQLSGKPSTTQDPEPLPSLSPHADDKPAPLFSGMTKSTIKDDKKDSEASSSQQNSSSAVSITSQGTIGSTKGTEDDSDSKDEKSESLTSSGTSTPNPIKPPAYQEEIDGSPVVGDLLKMMFVQHQVVPYIFQFFFRFPWNNFLHNVVYDLVQQIFNGPMDRGYNKVLAEDLFINGAITERIIEGQKTSDKAQKETNVRLGYMGHLTLIAEEVVKFAERHTMGDIENKVLQKILEPEWTHYVEHTLAETRERDNAILGGVRPDMNAGPRQTVLNSITGGNMNWGATHTLPSNASGGGLGTSMLDSMDVLEGTSGGGFMDGSGDRGTLLSGFNNSSDEEDEEMEEAEGGSRNPSAHVDESENPSSSSIPAPLHIPPSRARRQFAARLAQRKRALLDAAKAEEEGAEGTGGPEGAEGAGGEPIEVETTEEPESIEEGLMAEDREQRANRRFEELFSGMDSSSSGSGSEIEEEGQEEIVERGARGKDEGVEKVMKKETEEK